MKRAVIMSVLVLLIAGAECGFLFWLHDYADDTGERLMQIAALAQQDPDAALEELEREKEQWVGQQTVLGTFVHELFLEHYDDHLQEAGFYLKEKQLADFQVKIRQAVYELDEFYRRSLPTWENIL